MINIVVFASTIVDIENKGFNIASKEDMVKFIKEILDKAYYSGERICLEIGNIDNDKGKVNFSEIERWSGRPL